MKYFIALLLFITSIMIEPKLEAQAVANFVQPIVDEWAQGIRRETEYAEWFNYMQIWSQNQGTSLQERGTAVDHYVGFMALLSEEKVSESSEYSQKLQLAPIEFDSTQGKKYADLRIDDIIIGTLLNPPLQSTFFSLKSFAAFWMFDHFQSNYMGILSNSAHAEFKHFKYLEAADYIVHTYRDGQPRSFELGLGIVGSQPTLPEAVNELPYLTTYFGEATAIESTPDGTRQVIKGYVNATLDPVEREIYITVEFGSRLSFNRKIPLSKNSDENIRIGFYGAKGEELGGAFSAQYPDMTIQGIFGGLQ